MIHIGTSGYSFPDWKGTFYPEQLPARKQLSFYAETFTTVEINASFYQLPTPSFANMRSRVPPDFLFWVKIFRGLTHEEQYTAGQAVKITESVKPLKENRQLSGLLAQFPWGFRNTSKSWERVERLRDATVPNTLAVEFRHNSWDNPEVYERLQNMGLTYCIADEPQMSGLMPPTVKTTSNIGYFRFHGRNNKTWWSGKGSERYDYKYSQKQLEDWMAKIKKVNNKTKEVFVFFNNCHAGQAARNAQTLKEMLGQSLPQGRLF